MLTGASSSSPTSNEDFVNSKPIHILLVDDDQTDRMSVQRMLRKAEQEFTIRESVDLAQAREALAEDSFDVALIDYRLPDGTALDLLNHPALAHATPAIVMTGLKERDLAKRLLRHGAQDYLTKGDFDHELLARSIGYALERRRGEDLRRQLMRADRLAAIGRLAAAVAHEVNNPATFILSNFGIISKRMGKLRDAVVPHLDDDVRAEVETLFDSIEEVSGENKRGLERITDVVRDLGVFSRMDTDEVEPVNVNDVLRGVVKLAHNELRHSANVKLDLDDDVPSIMAARGRLGQTFTNLLVNAAHAMREGRPSENEIRISTRLLDDQIEIQFSDTGPGIPAEHLEKIFDPFFTTKPSGEGTGLGLAISLEIVQAHRGEMAVKSSVQTGTTFTILLPLDTGFLAPSSSAESQEVEDFDNSERLRPRILFIDDEKQLLHSFAEALEDLYDIVGAATGEAALDIIRLDDDFDVVICDVQIPGLDGIELYHEIKRIRPDLATRFVFLTGGAFTDRARNFLQTTTLPVLEKPLSPEQLSSFIDFTINTVVVEE